MDEGSSTSLGILIIPLLSLLPCVLWLWYFSSRSRYKRPSRSLLTLTFVLGALATIPALGLNLLGQQAIGALLGPGDAAHLVVLLLVVGPVEESIKFLVVFGYSWRKPEFDEPLDGVIYSAAAALGFAAAENLIYLAQSDPTLVLLRGPLSNPGHALFSALWGLSLSRAKAVPNMARARFPILAMGLGAASLVHSLFDLLLVAAARWHEIFFILLLVSMVGLFLWVRSRINYHRANSPHGEGTIVWIDWRFCQECGARGTSGEPCPKCGAFIPVSVEQPLCPVCTALQRPGAKFCKDCGANMKMPAQETLDTRPHFLSISPSGEEKIAYILDQSQIDVGRTLNNEFVIDHESVSKRHARIVNREDGYLLTDLASSNGTFVEGRRVTEARLQDGCEVRFGRVNYIYRAPRR
ncbi:MAG: PrsW family glutamic-type intramembrane protease [Blastocatellia bacterium]